MRLDEGSDDLIEDSHPWICVFLTTFNGADFLEEQLESLLSQEKVKLSLVVSDDGSTDQSIALFERFLANNAGQFASSKVYLQGESRLGAGGNFKWLMENADIPNADFFAFCDQDDVWLPDKLHEAVKGMREKGASCYSSSVTAWWSDGSKRNIHQSSKLRELDFLFEGGGHGCTFVFNSSFFYRTRKFLSINRDYLVGFHYHDWLIYLLARTWNDTWLFDRRARILYRQHAANDTGARFSRNGVHARVQKIKSGWYREQVDLAILAYELAADFGGRNAGELAPLCKFRSGSRFVRALVVVSYGRRKFLDRLFLFVVCIMNRL